MNKPYTVCLLGAALDGGNLGVGALAASLVGLVRRARPEARILMFYGERRGGVQRVETANGAGAVRVINFRLSPRARLREHLAWLLLLAMAWRCLPPLRRWLRRNTRLRALEQADFAGAVHGGDSFSDIYGLRRFLIGIVPDAIMLLLGKNLVLLPQTIGPFRSPAARLAARAIASRAHRIYTRDSKSLLAAGLLLGGNCGEGRVRLCPDVAFALEPINTEELAVRPPLPKTSASLLVGLNVSGLLAMGGYTGGNMFGLRCDYNALVRELIDALMRVTHAHVLLVPHVVDDSGENDVAVCREVWRAARDQYGGRVHLLTGRYGAAGAKAVIGRCDFFIGSRMHACIGALSQGVPAVGIAYSAKFRGVFKIAGAGELALDARRLPQEEILARCLSALRNRSAIRRCLEVRIPELRGRLAECIGEELQARGMAVEKPDEEYWRQRSYKSD